MIWDQVWLFPDPELGWQWADVPIVGVPALARVLLALKRAGIGTVHVGAGAEIDRRWTTEWARRFALPELVFQPSVAMDLPPEPPGLPTLAIRWGVIFSPQLLQWLESALEPASRQPTYATTSDGMAFLCSGWLQLGKTPFGPMLSADEGGAVAVVHEAERSALVVPVGILCCPVGELMVADKDRVLLGMVGKPTDRWHVVWVREWSFGMIRWLANRRITPNQVTLLGFLVAVLACLLLARGRYWTGILGAVLLYGSWVLDCMDGTLARLTFSESSFGRKLDTVLGHITNLAIFAALIWAVYGQDRWWKVVLSAIFMLGGILMAFRVSEAEKRLRPVGAARPSVAGLARFLDKINHRDYAVVILVLAAFNGFSWFLWMSLVGVQVFWLVHLWLIHQHQTARNET
jgi:phosphatidylglycerophosphate synthase